MKTFMIPVLVSGTLFAGCDLVETKEGFFEDMTAFRKQELTREWFPGNFPVSCKNVRTLIDLDTNRAWARLECPGADLSAYSQNAVAGENEHWSNAISAGRPPRPLAWWNVEEVVERTDHSVYLVPGEFTVSTGFTLRDYALVVEREGYLFYWRTGPPV